MSTSLLASQPFWIGITLGAYLVSLALAKSVFRSHPTANPVLLAIALLCLIVHICGVAPQRYLAMSQPLVFLIGPATVSLALPLWRFRALLKQLVWPVAGALCVGCLMAYFSTIVLSRLIGFDPRLTVSLASRATTAPVSMALAEIRGGSPVIAMLAVLVSGIIGAVSLSFVTRALRIKDPEAIGFTAGLCAHAVGVTRALQLGETEAAFASVGMLLNALATSGLVAMIMSLN